MLPCYLQPFSSNSLAWELSFLLASFAKREWWGYSKHTLLNMNSFQYTRAALAFARKKCKINSAYEWILIFLVEIKSPVPSFPHDIHEILLWVIGSLCQCVFQSGSGSIPSEMVNPRNNVQYGHKLEWMLQFNLLVILHCWVLTGNGIPVFLIYTQQV